MIKSASTSEAPKGQSSECVVNRASKLTRDPLRRALLEALSRSPRTDREEDDNGEE